VSLIPFLLFLFFSINEGKEAVISNIKEDLKQKNKQTRKLIEKDLIFAITQMAFWSNYPIMDDILVEDIDKRIAKFLQSAKNSIDFTGELIVINKKGDIVASTNEKWTKDKFPLDTLNSKKVSVINYKNRNYFLLYNPVISSFNNVKIGYLIFLVDVTSLNKISADDKGYFSFVYNKKYLPNKRFSIPNNKKDFLETDLIFLYFQPLSEKIFKDKWYVVSGAYKVTVFAPIEKIQNSFMVIGILGIFGIFLLSLFVSNKIINPIKDLSKFANEIAQNKNYSKRIEIHSKDEIGHLADSFNKLIEEIEEAIEKLENENKERLFLFIKLVQFFNKIAETKNKNEIIDLLNKEIKDFFDCKSVSFSMKKESNSLCFNMGGNILEKKDEYLCFKIEKNLSKEEKEFLKSISRLVSLWLERLQLIEQLKELLEKAESSSNAKSAFIANMSHELRTPLNSIIGFSHYIETSKDIPEEYKEIAQNIKLSGKHLLNLINDILDFAKIEAKKVQPKIEKFNINQVLKEIITIITPMAQKKGLRVILPEKTDIEINSDKTMIKQILINLLSNAVKFTEEGYVKLEIKEKEDKVLFIVEDTGIGISKEDINRIFNDFEQIQNPLQKKYKGTGLGLALVKRLTKLLNGKIEVQSEGIGKGAKFILTIPKEN
jgi:signal transduction histidine kinase/HAMP domain-containing protein